MTRYASLIAALVLLPAVAGAQAPAATGGGGIYNCVDARGRNLTSDRPIAECSDREQRELNPSGTTRRRIEPTYTAREQAERDERAREAAQRELRVIEERRRERALLMRYPNPQAHARARDSALEQIDAVMQAARKRIDELRAQRKQIDDELEFYKKDPSKAPALLRRQIDDNAQSIAVQNRFIGEQDDEKKRVIARFQEESERLRVLWTAAGVPVR
ncbi:MAG: DUF4124 domain-containing protein [Comamonadaceae bacterium]|nr:MAG: DUF4124 domain-containing protein [Comamonadaceae bacterium]